MSNRLFKRPDKGMMPTYHASDGLYWIQDYKNDGIVHHWDGGGRYLYALAFRPNGREERKCTSDKFVKLIKKLKLKYVDGGDISMYEDKYKEYLYSDSDKKLVIQYKETWIAWDFISYKECLKYAEEYVITRYSLNRTER